MERAPPLTSAPGATHNTPGPKAPPAPDGRLVSSSTARHAQGMETPACDMRAQDVAEVEANPFE